MSPNAFQNFIEQLQARLDADPRVLGLVLLGSTADASYRDAWSDHDFWVITETGAQGVYLDTPAWLPDAASILLTARHGISYRTVLYRDGTRSSTLSSTRRRPTRAERLNASVRPSTAPMWPNSRAPSANARDRGGAPRPWPGPKS